MGDEIFDDILVAKPIASRHRIFEVIVERIATCDDACGAPSAATVWLRIG